ncbi:hypothetical protein [Pedobacter sp. MW01-1-1]|uniref:hypothetical protein n=1 Tax=Pedobacter sp. MW01-1-1 TaxID=3383027 RepID=UPI003FEFDF08
MWIIGLGVASITLIIINTDKVYLILNKNLIAWVIILLVISMISGVLYRIFFFGFRYHIVSSIGYLEDALVQDSNDIEIDAEDLPVDTPIPILLERLLSYFGENLYDFVDGLGERTEVQDVALKKTLLDRYDMLRKWARKDFYLGNMYVRDSICKAFNLSRKELKYLKETKYNFLKYSKICNWFLFFSIGSFVVSVLVFAIGFLINNV